MKPSPLEQDRWDACPPGRLVDAVRGFRARQRGRRHARIVGIIGSAAALLLVASILVQQFGRSQVTSPPFGKMTCTAVKSLLPAYIAGKLEAAVAGQIEAHLEGCPHCRQHYDRVKDETAASGQPADQAPQLALRG